jgi:GNAT superfamily N-acetyltransferase
MELRIIEADYRNPSQCSDIAFLTNAYALDEMGGAEPLPEVVLDRMVEGLRTTPGAFTFLAYLADQPAGIANCFTGFSTFEAQRLINIHDLAVIPEARGKGIGTRLLEAVQRKARKLKCCKLTLEVRDDNPAIELYERFGFENGEPGMRFMTKEFY